MTNREEINAMSNAEFGIYLSGLIFAVDPCRACPAKGPICFKNKYQGRKNCADTIADWLRAEA